jgi:RHS repeat-associated protein
MTNQAINSVTADGSGYAIAGTGGVVTITDVGGNVGHPPVYVGTGSASYTDHNGNKISINSTGTFTDTLGTNVLTVAGSGTPSSPKTLTYTSPSGAASYTVKYSAYTVQTSFNCTGISEYGPTSVNLISEIDLPDNSKYTFNYEPTHGLAGKVTGRIASITLPTGGSISYAYSTGGTGVNSISCSDGSASTLVRTLSDGASWSSIWTYSQVKNGATASTTTITDPTPQQNQTLIQFQGIYETERKVYQGSTSGTLLQTIDTCYNNASSPCTGTTISTQVTTRSVISNIPGPGNLTSRRLEHYSAVYGMLTEADDYDFGPGAPQTTPLKTTQYTYTSLGLGLNGYPTTVKILDGTGTVQYRQDYAYDQAGGDNAICVTGAPQHDDTNYGCSFTMRGNKTSVTTYLNPAAPAGGIIKNYTYDSLGNVRTAQVDCCQSQSWTFSATTAYAYPDSVTSGTTSPTLTTNYTYDLNMGLALTSTDPNNLRTSLTYDNMGRTLSVQVGTNPTTSYTYTDSAPWSTKVCSPIQGTSTACQKSIMDGLGRTLTSQLLDGNGTLYSATDSQYDLLGRAYKVSNPYTGTAGYWTQTSFDVLGRAYNTTLPDSSFVATSYVDNTAIITDPSGKQRKSVTNALGRLTNVYEPDPSNNNTLSLQTSYTYNVLGQLTQASQGVQTRSYVYDALGRILSSTSPEGGTTCFGSFSGSTCNSDGYDTYNNLLKRTDARGVLTSYSYDTLNRLNQVTYNVGTTGVPATSAVTRTYGVDSSCTTAHGAGCIGHVITLTDGIGSENYTYDSLERLTQVQKVIGGTTFTTSYAFSLAGTPTQITYPSGRVIQRSVDAIGRLCELAPSTTACGSAASPFATGYSYSVANQVTGFKYGNGIFASSAYSPDRLQLSCLDYSTTNRNGNCTHDSSTKFGLAYSYGTAGSNNGQITGITDNVDTGRSIAYTYDSLARLSTALTSGSVNYPQWGLSWGYDRYGNRLNQTLTAGSGYSGSVSVSPSSNRISSTGYSYDADGNLTNDGSNTLVYDAENRFVSASNGSSAGAYTYDGNNLRVKKCVPNCTNPTTTTVYLFSGSKVIAEYDNGAVPTAPSREYVYGGAALLAKVDSGGTEYYHQDHLSNRLITSSTGATVEQMGHYPFGDTWYNATNDKLFFTTYEHDTESGNDYAIARSYVNRIGRFTSMDSLPGDISNPQSLNRFPYVKNDPENLVDPMGMDSIPMQPLCPPNPKRGCRFSGSETGGGGGSCSLDGVDTSCSTVVQMVQAGATTTILVGGAIGIYQVYLPGGSVTSAAGTYTFSGEWATINLGHVDVGGGFFDTGALQYQQYQGMRLLKGLTPTVCGGGGFLFLGAQGQKYGGQGFAGGLLEWDSQSGWSGHGLFELGSHGAGGGVVTNPLGGLVFLPVAEGAIYGVPVEGGVLATDSGSIGAFAEAGKGNIAGGVGGYVTIGSGLGCGPG